MALIVCAECGRSFSDKRRCCPECGCPSEQAKEVKDSEFTYLGRSVHIKKSVDVYLELCKKLTKMAQEGRRNLKEHEFRKGENHLNKMAKIVLTPVKDGVDLIIDCFNKLGWSISEEDFYLNEEESFSAICCTIESYENEYSKLVQEIADMDAYRNFRQTVRGRFVGGGIGVEGMIKGALTATAANAVVGAGYSVANFVGNVGTRLRVDKKALQLSEIYRTVFLNENLIEITLKNIELSFLKLCSEYDDDNYMQEWDVNHNRYDEPPCLINIANEEKKFRSYLVILESNPYWPAIYKALLVEYGDEKDELAILARKYGIDINRIKKDLY